MTKTNNIDNLVVVGQITATSKKQDGDFKQQIPTKTAYISVDDENAKKLEDFGLTKYTSKNGEDYFIVKFPANLVVYYPNGLDVKKPELSQIHFEGVETNNFATPDDKKVGLNIIKGNHMNNDFYRLQAIRIESDDDIVEVKPENPFGDDLAF